MTDRNIPTLAEVERTYGQLATAKEIFYDWGGANTKLFKFINGIQDESYSEFMRFATQIGDKKFFLPYLAVIAVYALCSVLYRKLLRKGGVKQHFVMWIGVFAVMATSFVAYVVIVSWLKNYFEFPRPYVILEGVTLLEIRDATDAYHSFPSGHVAFISLMIFSLWPLLSKHMKLFGLSTIALVAWSRVALGVHFPADGVWGCFFAFAIVYSVRVVIYNLLRKILGIHCDGS